MAPIFFLLIILFSTCTPPCSAANISAIFNFGDSTLDPGNNNVIKLTVMRADHPPYGHDFPGDVATGRFTNGKLVSDIIASGLGIRGVIPAYHDPNLSDGDLVKGVSFASSGAGIYNATSMNVLVLTMDDQVKNFEKCIGRMQGLMGVDAANEWITNASLMFISAGSNDMVANYYLNPITRRQFNLTQYQQFLVSLLQSTVEQIYNLGARKFVLAGLPPLGCVPLLITNAAHLKHRECVSQKNDDSVTYNDYLKAQIANMNSLYPDIQVVYGDIYTVLLTMMTSPQTFGFEQTNVGCCGTGIFELGPLCSGHIHTCDDPSKFLFWDAMHPTEAAYKVMADAFTKMVLPQFK